MQSRFMRAAGLVTVAFSILLLNSCGGSSTGTGTSSVASISLSPSVATVVVDGTQTITPTALDKNGTVLQNVTYKWASSQKNLVSVSSGGTVTGLATGQTEITASANGVTSPPATITVVSKISSVEMTPVTATIHVGETQQFTAVAKDQGGNPVQNIVFDWRVSFTGTATIDANGKLTAIAPGTVLVTATSQGITGPVATLTVVP